jgi:sugar phosphate isomerase/epimerase
MNDILKDIFTETYYPTLENPIKYDFKTSFTATRYWRDKSYTLSKMEAFVKLWKELITSDRLVVSNLCWKDEKQALYVLKRYGIKNLELALTKYQSWNELNLEAIKSRFAGFNIYSLQALFFGMPVNTFADTDAFVQHFSLLAKVATELGVKRLVFGSPSNRRIPQHMSLDDAKRIAVEAFRRVSKLFPSDITICIEHNATQYGCNFITKVEQAEEIVRLINCDNIKINYDIGNAMMMGENQTPPIDTIGHIQISAPFLDSIIGLNVNLPQGWNGKISMEAKEVDNFEDELIAFVAAAAQGEHPPLKRSQ